MAGSELILGQICVNGTCTQPVNNVPYYSTGSDQEFDTITNDMLELGLGSGDNFNKILASSVEKLRREISGKVLKVTYLEDYPLSYTDKSSNGTAVGQGVAFELLSFLTKKFNFTYQLVQPAKNILGSTQDMEGSILDMLQSQKADIAASFLPVLSDARKHVFYSSTSLDEGEWMMVMTRPAESATGSGLLAPFDIHVWILILISLIIVGPIIYVLLLIRTKLTKDTEQSRYSLPHCVWFVYGALMRQGSTLSPTGDSTRVLFATWWIFITILTSFYTANLTAFLTLSKFTLPINNVEDIYKKQKNFVANRGGAVEYVIKNTDEALSYLNMMVQKNLAQFVETLNDTDVLQKEVEKEARVFVRDKPAMSHLIFSDYKYRKTISLDDEKIHCPFAVAKTPFLKRRRSFAYPTNFPYRILFDSELLHLVESGIVKYMLLDGLPKAEICPNNLGGTERQLRNGDLMMTYYVMITGFSTSIVVFGTEMIFRFLNGRKLRVGKIKNTKVIKRAPAKNIFEIVTPPPPYGTIFNKNRHFAGTDALYGLKKDSIMTSRDNGNAQIINGRDYFVLKEKDGGSRLVPLRVPSAALFQYSYTN